MESPRLKWERIRAWGKDLLERAHWREDAASLFQEKADLLQSERRHLFVIVLSVVIGILAAYGAILFPSPEMCLKAGDKLLVLGTPKAIREAMC